MSDLIGAELDAAVAKALGLRARIESNCDLPRSNKVVWLIPEGRDVPDWSKNPNPFRPSTDWSQGGPIIERERIELVIELDRADEVVWTAGLYNHGTKFDRDGPTPLIAAMRAFVASKQ